MERSIELIRMENGVDGVFGVLKVDGKMVCLTLEPPMNGNRENVSCIPIGRYECETVDSPRFGYTVQVLDVPGRSHILFHAGNTVSDTHGCILLGHRLGELHGRKAVLQSRDALREFLALCEDAESLSLLIVEAPGGIQ